MADILRTYRAPREVQARRGSGRPREDRALVTLMVACALIFVAQWPRLSREAALDPSIALDARLAGALFAWLMIVPLVFYGLAWGLSVVLRAFGQEIDGYRCRMALFWAFLASTPVWLLSGLLAGFAPGPAFGVTSAAALALVVVFTVAGISVRTTQQESTP
ncbi:MAG: YIP1 family protein [Silicimonas sp.]|nr:YIP1 family protein [Silicimonas sp.]